MVIKRAAGFLIFRRLNEQIEYLMLRASYRSKHWTPPKGHVDPGEDDYTTALRETQEEAGYCEADLVIHNEQKKMLEYKVGKNDKIVVYWLAELRNPNQNPVLSDEHIDFRWLNKTDAKEICGFKGFATMIDYFHDQISTN